MQYLVFRLYAPLASWGQVAVGEERPTSLYPTRSAIIGLLSAALGLKREQESEIIKLNNSVQIAVKQLYPSSLLRDYHTTQVPSQRKGIIDLTRKMELSETKLNTILSSRDYRCDGMWVVAIRLSGEKFYSLERLQQALLKPHFTLYLGRKSCPLSVPLRPIIVENLSLKEALDTSFPPLTNSAKGDDFWLSGNDWVTYYWEGDKDEIGPGTVMTSQPWDNPLSKTRWLFSQRTVHQLSIKDDL